MEKEGPQKSFPADRPKSSQLPILIGTPWQVLPKPVSKWERLFSLVISLTIHTVLLFILSQTILKTTATSASDQGAVWITPLFLPGEGVTSPEPPQVADAAPIQESPEDKATEALQSEPEELDADAEVIVAAPEKPALIRKVSAPPALPSRPPVIETPNLKLVPAPALKPEPASDMKPVPTPIVSPAPPATASLPNPLPAPQPAPQPAPDLTEQSEDSEIKQNASTKSMISERPDEQKRLPIPVSTVVRPASKQLPLPDSARETEVERVSGVAAELRKKINEQQAAAEREAQALSARKKRQIEAHKRELAEQKKAEMARKAREDGERKKLREEQARQELLAKAAAEARERAVRLNEIRIAAEKLQQAPQAQSAQADRKIVPAKIPEKTASLVKAILPEQVKKQPQPPAQRPAFSIPQLKGDLKLVIVGSGTHGINFSFKALTGKKGSSSRAARETKITPLIGNPQENCHEYVIEQVQAGVYTITAEPVTVPSQATYALKIFENSTKATARNLGSYTIHKKQVLLKILMPEGVIWEDEKAFTGSMEDSDSITKFNTETGLVWKEPKI